jgi:hypothetical protein
MLVLLLTRDSILGQARIAHWKVSYPHHYLQLMCIDWQQIKCSFGGAGFEDQWRAPIPQTLLDDISPETVAQLQVGVLMLRAPQMIA